MNIPCRLFKFIRLVLLILMSSVT